MKKTQMLKTDVWVFWKSVSDGLATVGVRPQDEEVVSDVTGSTEMMSPML